VRSLLALLVSGWLVVCPHAMHTAVADKIPVLRVATFKCDATPPRGYPLFAGSLATVEHPLMAKGIVLDDRGQRYVLCAIDWCILANRSYQIIRERLADAARTTPQHVCVQVVHQHTAPVIDADYESVARGKKKRGTQPGGSQDFVEQTAARLAAAVRDSLARLEPFDTIGTGQAKVERVACARRVHGDDGRLMSPRWSLTKDSAVRDAPEGRIDPYLKTITLAAGKQPLVRLHYYAVHPQSWYGDGRASYDFVGMAREALERKDGAFQVYFTGCAGNLTVGKYNDGTPTSRQGLAQRLQAAMESSIASTRMAPAGPIHWRNVPLSLSPRNAEADLRAQMANPRIKPDVRARAAGWLAFGRRRDQPIDVTVLSIGRVHVVHLPGEPFVEYQLYAQQVRPDDFVAVAGYGDGGPWYICTQSAFAEGGYEPSASAVKPESEAILCDVIRQAISGL